MGFPKGMLGAAVLPRRQLQEEGVSIPPTVSTRSRSWKPARPEAGAWGARRKKTGELVQNAPRRQYRRHRHGTDTDTEEDRVGTRSGLLWSAAGLR